MDSLILSRFRINGLYGYKDVEIAFPGQARVLIAGNGSGKTTIFNALYAALSRKFFRLKSLQFRSIECEFFGDPDPVVIARDYIRELPKEVYDRVAQAFTNRQLDRDLDEVIAFLMFDYEIGGFASVFGRGSEIAHELYQALPGDMLTVGAALDELAQSLNSFAPAELRVAAGRIRDFMGGVDVLYLPTYRRIELPLLPTQKKVELQRFGVPQEQIFVDRSPDTRHINFGLADVEKRLNELSESVERESNFEYRTISATILDEALADQIEGSADTDNLPDVESLRRFLARVSQGDRFQLGLFHPAARPSAAKNDARIRAIENLYRTNEIFSDRKQFLRYFLSRLGSVIERTKVTEAMLQRFVEACNMYLGEATDEKILTYDPSGMRVKVINSWTGDDIQLAHLSSGEKQVVSILARLYLYENRRFVLIDEPELSLSIEWQKRILPDMIASGSVSQLFAITHSPFIFDNELDPFAGPLIAKRNEVIRNG